MDRPISCPGARHSQITRGKIGTPEALSEKRMSLRGVCMEFSRKTRMNAWNEELHGQLK